MLKTRGRKIIRDVLSRKGRTLLVALSIMIGVFGAVTLISVNDLIISQLKSDINPDEIAMTRVYLTVPTAGTNVLTEEGEDQLLALVREGRERSVPPPGIAGITQVEGKVLQPIYWQLPGDERFREGELLASSEPFDALQLEPIRLTGGEWPEPGQNRVAIERRMADEYGLDVGDTLVFRATGTGDIEIQEWTVTGIVFHPYWVGQTNENADRRVYTWLEDARQLTQFSGYSEFFLRYVDVNTSEAQSDDLMRTIARETNYIPTAAWQDDPDDYTLIREVQNVTNILTLLAIVALVVSGFLVTNVINTIVVEQKGQIGVLKSVGATRWDTFVIFAGIAAVYGILGTIPGVILGIIAGSFMAEQVAPLAFTLIEGFHVSATGIIVGALMGVLVPVLASLVPVFNATRVSIREAMTDLGISGRWGTGPLARLINALPLPINLRQALSNVSQKKSRLLLTVITLTLAAAAFMGVFAMFTVVNDEIDKMFDTFNYDMVIAPTEAQDYEQVSALISEVDGAGAVYPGVTFNVKLLDLSGTSIFISAQGQEELPAIGFDPADNIVDFTYEAGTGWQDDPERQGIVLTKPAADIANKTVGDEIVISAGGRSAEFEIIGIASYPMDMAVMRWQDLSRLAGFVDDSGTPDDENDDIPLPVVYLAAMQDSDPSAAEVDDVITAVSERLLDVGITANGHNMVAEQEAIGETMQVFNLIFQITSGVMAAVGAIGLLATLSMAVYERQKEIGVMRSIGARSTTIITQFLAEGILIGVLAWALAIPLSYLLALALLDGMGFADFIEFSYPLWVLGLGLVGMIVIASIASLWPSLSAARRTVSDILRYQ